MGEEFSPESCRGYRIEGKFCHPELATPLVPRFAFLVEEQRLLSYLQMRIHQSSTMMSRPFILS